MQWYCWIEGQQYGPAHLNDVHGWIREGRLHPGDHVWSEGMAEWTAAGNIPELFPPAAGAAATPQAGLPAPGVPPLAQPQAGYAGKGMCVGGMVLGIVSIVGLCCFCMYGIPSIIFGLVGLILSIVGTRQAKQAGGSTGMGVTGIILSAIGIALGVIVLVCLVVGVIISGPGQFEGFDFDIDDL